MQPESSMPSPGAERYQHPVSPERPPDTMPETRHEVVEKTTQEVATADSARTSAPLLPVLPTPSPAPTTVQPVVIDDDDDSPTVAADQDLIEEIWVNKAKKIVQDTRDDPYRQENQVTQLQADYLKKRYGKEIKLASDK